MDNFYSEEELEMHEIMDALGLSEPEAQLMRLVRRNARTNGTVTITLDEFMPFFAKHTLPEMEAIFQSLEQKGAVIRCSTQSTPKFHLEWSAGKMLYSCTIEWRLP